MLLNIASGTWNFRRIFNRGVIRTPESNFIGLENSFPYTPNYIYLSNRTYSKYRIHYIDERTSNYVANRGELFVCLHGGFFWSYTFRYIISHLLQKYSNTTKYPYGCRIIAPDYVGHGRSDKPTLWFRRWESPYAENSRNSLLKLPFYRDFIYEFFNQLSLHDITLICTDWGANWGLTIPNKYITHQINPLNGKIITIDNNPIQNIIVWGSPITAFHVEPVKDFILNWRFFNLNNPNVNYSQLLSGNNIVPPESVIWYSKPFPSQEYKLGTWSAPFGIPVYPDYPDTEIWLKGIQFYELNKFKLDNDTTKVKIVILHGTNDPFVTIGDVRKMYNIFIRTDESNLDEYLSGVIWVQNGDHAIQENPNIVTPIDEAIERLGI